MMRMSPRAPRYSRHYGYMLAGLIILMAALSNPEGISAEPADWPMWQYDAARTAQTPVELDQELHLQWVRELPKPNRAWPPQRDHRGKLDFDASYAPVVMGEQIFVSSNVTDSVTAYSIEDGTEQWRFYTNGPVRLAPAAWQGKLYFVSDDGHLYCVKAESGELAWKFRAGPSDHRLLGNERIINFWAARGGPVIKDGTVYFAAGIWPLHGIFIYALDADSGAVEWVNDTTSSDYVKLPHGGASGYGGLAPQGYLAASEDRLVVAGGRTPPAVLDRQTGEVEEYSFRAKPEGGYAVHAGEDDPDDCIGKMENEMLKNRVDALSGQIDGSVFEALAARGGLFVTTEDGALYCFGPEPTESTRHEYSPAPLQPRSNDWAPVATRLLDELGESEGYALMLGMGSGDLLRELLRRSKLHITVAENNPAKVRNLRKEMAACGMYGRRAAVIQADPAHFSVQPYLFSMVISEDAVEAGLKADRTTFRSTLDLLRPYGGIAWLGIPDDRGQRFVEAAASADVDQVAVQTGDGHLFARRTGPLSGAGQWTHQYSDPANTQLSRDSRVQLPLGVLWFGGPSNHNILPRHARGPKPQVAGGRQVFLGVETIAARCVYTGRQLWERKFPGIGHPFTNLALEEKWAKGEQVYMNNIPGASLIGSPFVTLPDSIYLRHERSIYRLDPDTGETLDEFELPGRSVKDIYDDEDAPEWGHISVRGDYLIVTWEPYIFEDQKLGWSKSYSGRSSRCLGVMDRYSGELLWQRSADIGFRHGAIVSADDTLYVIDGLSEKALEHLSRRGQKPEDASTILALNLRTGRELWKRNSSVFGTFLQYCAEHNILLEGGNQDIRRGAAGEPLRIAARRGSDGTILWDGEQFKLPAAVMDDRLVAGKGETPGPDAMAVSLLTGETWPREQPPGEKESEWGYHERKGCSLMNANEDLLLFRSGYAAYFDLEHDSGTGFLSGFKSGCTANLIPADGVLNALDYTRTCTCSYAHQTSLALIHMPGNSNIEFWTRYEGAPPDPADHGINFGAPGRRVEQCGRIWYDRKGTRRRHPSAIKDAGGSIDWVAASARELEDNDEDDSLNVENLLNTRYRVRLHFAELAPQTEPGQRVFDVLIDGEKIVSGLDIAERAGDTFRGVVAECVVRTDGDLTIELRSVGDSQLPPMINGIELEARGRE